MCSPCAKPTGTGRRRRRRVSGNGVSKWECHSERDRVGGRQACTGSPLRLPRVLTTKNGCGARKGQCRRPHRGRLHVILPRVMLRGSVAPRTVTRSSRKAAHVPASAGSDVPSWMCTWHHATRVWHATRHVAHDAPLRWRNGASLDWMRVAHKTTQLPPARPPARLPRPPTGYRRAAPNAGACVRACVRAALVPLTDCRYHWRGKGAGGLDLLYLM